MAAAEVAQEYEKARAWRKWSAPAKLRSEYRSEKQRLSESYKISREKAKIASRISGVLK